MDATDQGEVTREELLDEADRLAREVWGISANEALGRLKKGELAGTFFAARLAQIFWLLGQEDGPEDDERLMHAAE